ncbi:MULTISPECIES: MgtC/SapB family protein [Sphingobacterium]|uniref:MgtC/SapB family protein n=2 Tax=Sphingobacterium TaxID=28453 RepID=A0ABW5L4C3_9SPHI|nr:MULTISPECIES: MgtC/SapB family protein [Sphingobacterium]TDQ77398.1 putative Mg2+ transporter-C (MgtC) family protein [Sphingobacterium yanglingense]
MIGDLFSNENFQTIVVSLLCGSIVGMEREYRNKSAGFRTVILICLGATIFTMASRLGNMADDRIAANIVTGIGFLGAGVIFRGKFSVQGLTTAAVIWTMAAVGMLVGFGQFMLGISLAILMVVVLSLFQKMETVLSNIYFSRTIYVTFIDNKASRLYEFETFLKESGINSLRKGIEKKGDKLMVVYEISSRRQRVRMMNERIISIDYVDSFSNIS